MEIKTNNSEYSLIEELGILVNAEVKKEFNDLRLMDINEKEIVNGLRNNLDDEVLLSHLSSVASIALCVTEECNFRCKYCSYSGIYDNERVHSNKSMDYDNAIKTVDFFLNLISDNHRYRKNHTFSIGFYGGEPLLEFDLIRNVIADSERLFKDKNLSEKFKIDFRLTTNGYFLNREVVDILKNKNVAIDISLDGPEIEHDKFRVDKKGRKTWKTIMENLETTYRRYPEYYKKKIKFLSTVHPLHDEIKIKTFFKGNEELFDIEKIRFSSINLSNLKPHIYQKLDEQLKKKGDNRLGDLVFSTIVGDSITGRFKLKNLCSQRKFTGTCFPGGEKTLIDTGGKFHICEKMMPGFPIGDVHNGFDFDKIRNIVRLYNEEIIRHRCWDCDVWFLCNICFVHATKKNKIRIECAGLKQYYKYLIERYLSELETGSENIGGNFNSVSDYIDQL